MEVKVCALLPFSLDIASTNSCDLISDQEERQWAIREFRESRKDVLVATDIASKGLDFPNIRHIINYDMPADIENYGNVCMCVCMYVCMYACMYVCNGSCVSVWSVRAVHRIGRTGRCGKTGIATTFINKMCGELSLIPFTHPSSPSPPLPSPPSFPFLCRGVSAEGFEGIVGRGQAESTSFLAAAG